MARRDLKWTELTEGEDRVPSFCEAALERKLETLSIGNTILGQYIPQDAV